MPSLVKAISKIFGGNSKKSKGLEGNHYSDTPSSFPIDAKKIEKEKKRAQKNASIKKRGKDTTTSTSYSSGPHSAEIRIPGKLYLPVSDKNDNTMQQRATNGYSNSNNGHHNKKTKDDNIYLGQIVTIPLSENHHKLNSPLNNGTGKVKHNFHLHHHATAGNAATTNSLPAKHTSVLPPGPNQRSQRYFSDDDDSENQGGVVTNIKNPTTSNHHPYSSTFDRHPFDNDNGFSLSASPNLAAYLGTPTSSSDFCLSSDVEDEEYNRVKHRYNAGLLRPIAYSTSTEDESALFPALEGKGTGSVTSPAGSDGMTSEVAKPSPQVAPDMLRGPQQQHQQQRSSVVGQVLTVSGPLHKHQQQQPQQQQQYHTKVITNDGEDFFSPSSLRSPQQPSRVIGNNASTSNVMPTNSRFFPNQLQSPVPRSSSIVNSQSDAFGFDDFVVNDWPPTIAAEHVVAAPPAPNNNSITQVVQRRPNSNKNIISFDGADMGNNSSLTNVFAASDAAAAAGTKHSNNRSGDSVASAPLDELMAASRPSLNRVVGSPPARGSRSVAVPSRPSPSSYRSHVGSSTTRIANAQLLDKLERDLRDRNLGTTTNSSSHQRNTSSLLAAVSSKGVSATSSKRTQRSTNQSPDLDLFRRGDSSTQNPDQWLMEEVSDTLGPRGIAADLESLSGKSARSRTDRSTGGKSHRSHKSRSNKKNLTSSGNSVTSRTSNFSTHSYMSEASRSVANDLLRLEMQLAMVGNDRASGNVAESAQTAATTGTHSVGGIGNGASSYRSKRGVSGRHNRSSPTSSRRKTVVAPPGKLGLILANKSDGKGTVVSGVRAGSALAESISIGDRIVAVDGEDVSYMNVAELTTIMSRKSDFHRKLSVLSFSRSSAPSPVSRTRDMGA